MNESFYKNEDDLLECVNKNNTKFKYYYDEMIIQNKIHKRKNSPAFKTVKD